MAIDTQGAECTVSSSLHNTTLRQECPKTNKENTGYMCKVFHKILAANIPFRFEAKDTFSFCKDKVGIFLNMQRKSPFNSSLLH